MLRASGAPFLNTVIDADADDLREEVGVMKGPPQLLTNHHDNGEEDAFPIGLYVFSESLP